MDKLTITSIPSSFVSKDLKLIDDGGSGEAKLFIGSIKNEIEYNDFFRFLEKDNYTYKFDKENLMLYLMQTKIEYVYQNINKYKSIDLDFWEEKYLEVSNMEEKDFYFKLLKYTDSSRYYIRSDDYIFKKTFRNIALPKITNLEIEKNTTTFEFTLRIYVNYEYFPKLEDQKNNMNSEIIYDTNLERIKYEKNRIVFGAPGTGKSYVLEEDRKKLLYGTTGTYERVTFHPDYSYANFVGTYKPVMEEYIDNNGIKKNQIAYKYVPGPFMRIYVDALKSSLNGETQPHVLIIEEINRAKVAAVFGDIFQLLDRNDKGYSEYEINIGEDVRKYLSEELCLDINKINTIRIPNNMFIWATMNSADQGVFPMDTAFKRRWSFKYLDINHNEELISIDIDIFNEKLNWNTLRKAINNKLSKEFKVNEDKLMGPFFISNNILKKDITDNDIEISDLFINTFKNKVLMYLYEDAARQYRHKFFDSRYCDTSRYSSICNSFDIHGLKIFGEDLIRNYDSVGV